jgi:type IV pilus assembly protein PilY1
MLHGFRETDGEEVMAYIPGNLFSTAAGEGMHYLTDQNYGHRYYNDLTPTLSDIFGDIRGSGNQWNTILINGQRGGGRGIYALNVNDPLSMDQDNADKIVLWEFDSTDDPDLGYTFSQPQIAFTGTKWVAIFGNGYNDTGDGNAKLFIVDIIGGTDGSWDTGDVVKIDTGVGSSGDPNGLSTPRLADLDGDGTVDRAWAGDMYGNMWAFDISSETVAGGAPLFTTIGGIDEPITAPPALAKHPTISDDGSNAPNVMVYFGTGQYLVNGDKTSTDLNHFYGVWDRGVTSLTFGNLEKQTYQSGFVDANGDPVRVLSNNVVNYAGGEYGWHFELDETGEKAFFVPVVRGGIVFFTTFIPNPDPCSAGGDNYFFSVDMINGGSPDDPQVDTDGNGIVDDNDRVKNGGTTGVMVARKSEGLAPNPVFVDDIAYTGANPTKVKKLRKIPTGRFSWQEITP